MDARHAGPYISIITSTLVIGLLIAVYPLTPTFSLIRPEVICLLVIYWIMHLPQHLGMLYAFSVGLMQDIVEGTVWGTHALALTVIAYICLVSYQRIRNYSVWHQAFWVFIFVGVHQVMSNWVQGLAGYHNSAAELVLPTAMSALCWPLLILGLRKLRRIYRLA